MKEISTALELKVKENFSDFTLAPEHCLNSCFQVTNLAASSLNAVGEMIAYLTHILGLSTKPQDVHIDPVLASRWFGVSIQPIDWQMPPLWDEIAGDYKTRDGWIKLHTNLPHHLAAALSVLDVEPIREKVQGAAIHWYADDLEAAIVKAGGVAAKMRSRNEWQSHPQGKTIAGEPLIQWSASRPGNIRPWNASATRPLEGLKVLDLTRVLAGPVCTRTLAGFGADVLRLDPVNWDEANIVPDITLGKRCAFLDLKSEDGKAKFEQLIAKADILVHGYRPGALDDLGFDDKIRHQLAPHLIEVSLNAYGWSGPFADRRGFDSLVQMSSGITDTGMMWANAERPTPLPVQALDHATGYLMAAAVVKMLCNAQNGKGIQSAKLSLARTAELLISYPQTTIGSLNLSPEPGDFSAKEENTPWGPAKRLRPAISITRTPMIWGRPAEQLGTHKPQWLI